MNEYTQPILLECIDREEEDRQAHAEELRQKYLYPTMRELGYLTEEEYQLYMKD